MKEQNFRYFALSAVFMLSAIVFCANADWEPLFENPKAFIFFTAMFTVCTFLWIDIGDNNLLTLNDAIAFSALLSFGPSFASAVFFVGMMAHVIYYGEKIFLRLVFISVGMVEFFVAGKVYYSLLGGTSGLLRGAPDLLYASIAGLSLWLIDRTSAFAILSARGEKSITGFFKKLKPYAISFPPLYIWGMAASNIFHNSGYLMTAVFMLPLVVVYIFFRNQKNYQETLRETIFSLAKMIDARDSYTARHSAGVARNAIAIAKRLALSDEEIDGIQKISLLHDIGKIGIRDSILLKEAPLEKEEWEQMKKHSEIGAGLVANLRFLAGSSEAIKYHHERWDGKGYPDRLKGEKIPLWARIIAICDAWDAMRTDRPYRKALPLEIAIEEIKKGAGTQFDPKIVEIAIEVFRLDDALEYDIK